MTAYPSYLSCWDSNHQSVRPYIPINDCPSTDETVLPEHYPANNRRISTDGCSFFNQGFAVLMFSRDFSPRIVHVGEDHARSAENIILNLYLVIDANIILNLYPIADLRLAHIDVLPQGTPIPDHRLGPDMTEMPDLCSLSDLGARIDYGRGMGVVVERFHFSEKCAVTDGQQPEVGIS